jgi:beta-alanine--pyruvate transaminase
MTVAKGLTNGAVPMAATFVRRHIYDTFMDRPEPGIELFHGYTYSGHPIACAAALATLDLYREEGLFERAASLEAYWEDAVHSLRGLPHVVDLRNIGLVAGIELESRTGQVGARAFDMFTRCFADGLLIRVTGDIIALSPPLIIEKVQIDEVFETLGDVLKRVA